VLEVEHNGKWFIKFKNKNVKLNINLLLCPKDSCGEGEITNKNHVIERIVGCDEQRSNLVAMQNDEVASPPIGGSA